MTTVTSLNFEPMLVTDVFESMASSRAWYDKVALTGGDPEFLYLSQTQERNSVEAVVARQPGPTEPGNCITVTLKTQATFYQPAPFYTAQNFLIFRHPELDPAVGMFLVSVMRQAMKKFSWGYGVSMARLRKTKIMVPAVAGPDGRSLPDWDAMRTYGKNLLDVALSQSTRPISEDPDARVDLPHLRFAPYSIVATDVQPGIFRAHKGRRLTSADRRPGVVPFVGAARFNNSIVDFADVDRRFPAGWVTLVYNGDGGTGHAKYQPAPFNASDDVIVLEPLSQEATEASLLMLVTMLTRQCVSKFSFGYKLTLHRLSRQKIMVPVTTNADGDEVIDWAGMDAYGRVLRATAERQVREGLLDQEVTS